MGMDVGHVDGGSGFGGGKSGIEAGLLISRAHGPPVCLPASSQSQSQPGITTSHVRPPVRRLLTTFRSHIASRESHVASVHLGSLSKMASDLDQLVDMGFDREKSEMALKKSGNLTGAIDWLDKNAEKSVEELKEEQQTDSGMPEPDPQAKSMVCNDCGKKFRGMAQAQFHAEKSGHDDFSESAEEIAPLTEEEKKQKLEDMRAKLAEKRAGQAQEDKLAQKRNEEIKKKHTKEVDDAKEELQRKERMKEAAAKKKEKADDIAAKKRIKDQIEADKAARRQKAEEEKAMRANPAAYNPGAPTAAAGGGAAGGAAAVSKTTANHSEARLRLQTPDGNVIKSFPAETTLFEVAHALAEESGMQASAFQQNFPRKVFDQSDFGMTLKEAGLVPSAALIVR